jgi:hypothetical protein
VPGAVGSSSPARGRQQGQTGLPRLTRASASTPAAGVRSARLLFSDALADGRLAESDLLRAEVLDGMGVL